MQPKVIEIRVDLDEYGDLKTALDAQDPFVEIISSTDAVPCWMHGNDFIEWVRL